MDWPQDCAAAASITFDVDGEAAWIGIDPVNRDRPGVLSQGTFGPKIALPLILDLLDRQEIKGTFFVPGVVVQAHRAAIEAVIARGHELALHGYTHTAPALLSAEEERSELDRAYDVLSSTGAEISGYRSPAWDISEVTLDLLEQKQIRYTSQFMDDITPYRHAHHAIVELPIQWILDDWPHFAWSGASDSNRNIRSSGEVEEIWTEELDGVCDWYGCAILTMHPQVIGRPSRVKMLERVLEHVRSRGDTWIATCSEIAVYVDTQLPETKT